MTEASAPLGGAMIALGILAAHSLGWLVLAERRFRRNTQSIPRMTRRPLRERDLPPLAVIVPARNEEKGIESALRSLLAQDYPRLRIVCGNDHSTDGTGEILRRLAAEFPAPRFTVFDVPKLPPGWMGKCHAVWHGVRRAGGEPAVYLFTDADVVHAPGSLRRAASDLLRRRADLLAVMPVIECVGAWENAILPMMFHFAGLILDPRHITDPSRPETIGVGAFTMIRREAYEGWGGHAAIRGEVLDDIALGRMTKRAGGRIAVVRDPAAVRVRMYDGLESIVRGFEKNMAQASGGSFPAALLVVALALAVHLSPAAVAVWAMATGDATVALLAIGVLFATGAALGARMRLAFDVKPALVAAMFPLGVVAACGILLKSAWHTHVEGVILWRGRRIVAPVQKTGFFR